MTTVDISDLANVMETLRAARLELDKWKEVEEDAIRKIKARMINVADEATIDGHTVVTWRESDRTDLDVKRLRADLGDVLAPYMRTKTVRTFRVVD